MNAELVALLWRGTLETLWMVLPATVIGGFFGLLLAIGLIGTQKGGLFERPGLSRVLEAVVNIGRSFPFIVLMILLIPLTRALVGSSIGPSAAIVPLAVAAIPFAARLAEGTLREVPVGVLEAAQTMGASRRQTVLAVLLPEAKPALIRAFTVLAVALLGHSAVAGAIGAGGLGDLAIRYGYHRFDNQIMLLTVFLLLLLVAGTQALGDKWAAAADKR